MKYSKLLLATCVVAAALQGGCDFVNTKTKTANGQLYQSGDGRYDPYFNQVHQDQLTAANWPDEAKNSRKPIITALSLRPGTGNGTILGAAKEKKNDATVGKAVDETINTERERARKLTQAAGQLEELLKRGEELRKETVKDKQNLGADKADDKKVAKKDEVKSEMSAAVDAVDSMLTDAKKGAKEADELARKLRGAWKGTDEEEPAGAASPPPADKKDDDKKDEKKEPDKKDEKKKPSPPAVAKKPAPKPAAATGDTPPPAAPPKKPPPADPAEKPAPKQPAQKPPDEVFNP
jgi:hypothetical protein